MMPDAQTSAECQRSPSRGMEVTAPINGAVAKYAASRAAPSIRSAYASSTTLTPYLTNPSASAYINMDGEGSFWPKTIARANVQVPAVSVLNRTILIGSLSDKRCVRLLSMAQHKQANAIAPAPTQSASIAPGL